MDFNESEVLRYYESRCQELHRNNGDLRTTCPIHNGKDNNFSIDVGSGMSFCHSQCSRGWDMIGLEMELGGLDFIRAKAKVFELVGRPLPSWQERDIEATYDYTDEKGQLLYQVVRKAGKKFMQRRPDVAGSGRWVWGLGKVPPVPFNLPRLAAVPKETVVGICEGEGDALALTRAGWVATCNNGGAGNFKPELAPWFLGRHVAIFPDNDEPGRKHAESVAKLLEPVAASVRVVEIPDLPLKGDVSDFLAKGKTAEDLYALYEASQDWTPDWKFTAPVPHENDKYLRTFGQFVEQSGGYEAFWKTVEVEGLPTPFDELTKNLGGLHQGEVYVIAANQGAGKTSLAKVMMCTTQTHWSSSASFTPTASTASSRIVRASCTGSAAPRSSTCKAMAP